MSVTNLDFELFRDYLEKHSGIMLGDNKQYLVTSRLRKIMESERLQSLAELLRAMQSGPRSGLYQQVIDAMTTNETLWFRDGYPFEVMKNKVLPELTQKYPNQRLRIWSAASSSGQEPFSLSMMVDEYERSNPGQLRAGVQIVATDLSVSMIEACKRGEYDALSMGRGLSLERQQRYFEKLDGARWRIKQPVRQRVEFRQLNLLDSYALLGKFDVVFCRNVLIYFSAEVKKDILRRIHATLKPGGYLFLGASEALNGLPELYSMVQCSPGIIYQAR